MKVLHIYPSNNDLIRQHVSLLVDGLQHSADIRMADSFSSFKQHLNTQEPDIIHCHGCWSYAAARSVIMAYRKGARLVITPHGQLEPWYLNQQLLLKKLCQMPIQKKLLIKAYTIITLGNLEKNNFCKLNLNKRVETISNAVTTNTITPQEMCTRTFYVYQKVMDSNTIEQMDEQSISALSTIIKAGIAGDARWCSKSTFIKSPQEIDWRRLLIYAEHENIRNYIDYGMSILGIPDPGINTQNIKSYFPDNYSKPIKLKEVIGEYEGNETEYLVKIIRQIHKQPQLLHIIELTRELMRDNVNDDLLKEALDDKRLLNYTHSLIQILKEQTLLDEGFMPLIAVENHQTQRIRRQMSNHLKI